MQSKVINNNISINGSKFYWRDNKSMAMSSLSVYIPFMLVYLGSDGDTKMEIKKSLNIKISDNRILEEIGYYMATLPFKDLDGLCSIANIFIMDKKVQADKEYLNMISPYSAYETFNFGNYEKLVLSVNKYISDNTFGKIKNILELDDIDSNTVMMMINTIYFKCSWHTSFEPKNTKPMTFQTTNSKINVPMMHGKIKKFTYYDASNYNLVELPFMNDDYAMGISLPRDNNFNIPNDLLSSIEKLYQPAYELDISIPKFRQESKHKMVDFFKSMDIHLLFDDKKSNLTGIRKDAYPNEPNKVLYVSDIIQNVVVEINEEGAEASAASVIKINMRGVSINKPIKFVADHTFTYYIRHIPTKTIIFIGVFDG